MSGVDKQFSRYYRPNSLEGYIGNQAVKETIINILKRDRLPQSIMLYGMTGCGKTTMARLIAKEYMCQNRDKEHLSCGVCDVCTDINHYIETGDFGNLQDLKEVDITASSGKEDITQLLDEMSYPSMMGGWKIYIFDEVQMASKQAQQRMLKFLEEPTEKVCVIFCTTNPEMILDTLKNRCSLKLQIKKPSMSELCGLLRFVCEKEGIEYNFAGLKMISAKADFIIRESLQLLEQLIQSRGSATEEAFTEEFREIGDKVLFPFFEAYLKKDSLNYLKVLHQIKTTIGEFNSFLSSTLDFLRRGINVVNGIPVDGMSDLELKQFSDLFKKFSEEDIGFLVSSLLELRGSRDLECGLIALLYKKNVAYATVAVPSGVTNKQEQLSKEGSHRDNSVREREEKILKESKDSLKGMGEPVKDISSIFNLKRVEG